MKKIIALLFLFTITTNCSSVGPVKEQVTSAKKVVLVYEKGGQAYVNGQGQFQMITNRMGDEFFKSDGKETLPIVQKELMAGWPGMQILNSDAKWEGATTSTPGLFVESRKMQADLIIRFTTYAQVKMDQNGGCRIEYKSETQFHETKMGYLLGKWTGKTGAIVVENKACDESSVAKGEVIKNNVKVFYDGLGAAYKKDVVEIIKNAK